MKRIALSLLFLLFFTSVYADGGWQGQYFNEHTDQEKTAPSDGQIYQWDATQELWVLGTVPGLESDPQVGSNTNNYIPKWNGSALVAGTIFDNGNIGVGTTAPTYKLQVNGTFDATTITQNGLPLGSGGWTSASGKIYPSTITDNIGIGTTAPSATLDLVGTLDISGLTSVDFIKDTHIDWGTGAGQVSPSDFANEDIGDITITTGVWAVEDDSHAHGSGSITEVDPNAILTNGTRSLSGNWNNGAYAIRTLGNVGVGTTTPQAYALYVSGDEYVTGSVVSGDEYNVIGNIGALGNVGAGTTAPIDRLDVRGSGNAILNMTGNVGVGTTLPVGLLQVGTSPNAPLVVLKNGNVGVGTTNPTFRLQVNNADLSVGTGDIYVGSYVFHSADTDTAINFTTDQIDFIAGNVTLLSLDESTQDVIKFGGAAIDVDVNINSQVFVEGSSGNVGVGTTAPKGVLHIGTSPGTGLVVKADGNMGVGTTAPATLLDVNGIITATSGNSTNWNTAYTHSQDNTQAHSDYLLNNADDSTSGILTAAGYYSTGNVGVGNTLPQALLDVGTSPGVGLIVKNNGNVGVGTTAPARKLDIIGTMRTSETYPLFRLNILDVGGSVGVGTTIPGAHLHIGKAWVIDRLRSWLTGGTSVNFTVKGSVFPGTGPFYNLFVEQTSVPGGLTVAGSASTTVPADHLVIIDIIGVQGTAPGMGIILDGHEQ